MQASQAQRIPGVFQVLLAFYIVLTGDLPTLLQGLAFGVHGSAGSEFALAMTTSFFHDVLLFLPIMMLANFPLGILHPLILSVIVWPIMTGMAYTVQDLGGWAGILAGTPVEPPYYTGLLSHSPARVWNAITKYNVVQIIGLLGIYLGFWLSRAKSGARPAGVWIPDPVKLRPVIVALFAASMLVLAAFVQSRGGLLSHLLSLSQGRFRELRGDGPIIVLANIGSIAIFLWVAARPGDMKSPLFLTCAALVTVSQFVSNGSRSSAIETPMVAALVWAIRTQKVPWRMAILLGPAMFISIGLLGAVRTLGWTGDKATVTQAVVQRGVSGSFAAAQAEIAQRRAASAPVPVVARGMQVTHGPLLGQSYVAALTAVVPRAIWPGKPRGTGSLYVQLFHGGSDTAGGIPVPPTAEMYWNFSYAGVLFLSMLYGMLLQVSYKFLWRHYPNPFAIVFYVIFLTGFDMSTRKLVDFQQSVGLLLICYFLIETVVPKIRLGRIAPPQRFRIHGQPAMATASHEHELR